MVFKRSHKKTKEARTPKKVRQSSFLTRVRLSVKEQTIFAKRMSFLVRAGVPMLEGIEMLRKQTKSKATSKMYETIAGDIANGKFLSTSLQRFDNVFGDFAINIIKVGETSGILGENLSYLAEELKKKHQLKRKVMGALVYPIIVTIATVGLTALLTAYIFPKILPIFKSLHTALPWSTRVLIFISDLLRNHGFLILIALIAIIIGFIVAWKKVRILHLWFDRLLLRVPIGGSIARYYNLTNTCRTMGLLLKSGTRVVEAVTITADTTKNLLYKTQLYRVAKGALEGQKISKYFEATPKLFPDMMSQMVAIGEKTGNLPETLMYLSEMYEHDLDEATRNLSSSIEPIMMVLMGLVVGFVAVSIITPIYQITQNLG